MKIDFVNDVNGKHVGLAFYCPGCKERHHIGFSWIFNQDFDVPTFSPSILVRSGHYTKEPPKKGNCYCDYTERYPDAEPLPANWTCYLCHFFIRNGQIVFLPDCTHSLAGQTRDLVDLTEETR